MSESTVKAARRDLRRVLGDEAAQALRRQSEALAFTTETVRHHQDTLQAHSADLGDLKIVVVGQDERMREAEAFRARDWRGRLRWIFTGR